MQFELKNFKRILDIGGGHHALDLATEVADWRIEEKRNGKVYHEMDVCSEPLPFGDGEIDFVYCRQTLEDLSNPVYALQEMRRVGKYGYIETPHVLTELRLGIQNPDWRGWAHHNWFVWSVHNTIKLLPKSTALGLILLDDAELSKVTEKIFPDSDYNMSCHSFFWSSPFAIKRYINGKDFDFSIDYGRMIQTAIQESVTYHTIIRYDEMGKV